MREECLGGERGRVVVEWAPLVKRRDMLVVVVEVLDTGPTGGERGCNAGIRGDDFASGLLPFKSGDDGWSVRILRRDSTVR